MSLEKSIDTLTQAVDALRLAVEARKELVTASKAETAKIEAQITPPVAVEPSKAPEQKDVIKAFGDYAQKPGASPDKMRAILAELGAKSVVAIPKDKWAEAIAKCQAAV